MVDDAPASEPCPRCGEAHALIECPHVKAVEYDSTGKIVTRVEFLTPADYHPMKGSIPDAAAAAADYAKLGKALDAEG